MYLFKRIIILLFIISCLFPYTTIVPSKTDAQPYPFLFSLLLLPFLIHKNIDKYIFSFLIVFLFSVLILFYTDMSYDSLRSLFSYVSLLIISYVTYECLKMNHGIPFRLYFCVVFIWTMVGAIQLFVYPDFVSFLIPRNTSISSITLATGRGVTSLAAEPTHFGWICLYFFLITYLNFKNNKNVKWIYLLLAIQLFVLSKSSACIFILVFSYILFTFYQMIIKRRVMYICYTFVFLIMLYFIIPIVINIASDYRIGVLLSKLWENPTGFTALDGSVEDRIGHVLFSLYAFVNDYGIPHGYGTFAEYITNILSDNTFEFINSANVENRIGSSLGACLYELGLIGLIPFIVIVKMYRVLNARDFYNSYFFILFICVFLLGGPAFSTAITSFYVGNIIYIVRNIDYDYV